MSSGGHLPGRVFDPATGLQYNNARFYDPHTGRFISEDPIQDGANWYTYTGNDPINNYDPKKAAVRAITSSGWTAVTSE